MFFMKKISTLLFAVLLTAITGAFAHESLPIHNGHFQLQADENEPIQSQTIENLRAKSPQLKIVESQQAGGLVLAGDYKYNASGMLIEKSSYKFDNTGRQIEKTTYIYNDYSKTWMQGREQWICSYVNKRTFDPNDDRYTGAYMKSYENLSLNMSTGALYGTRYESEPSSVTGFTALDEYYSWDVTTNSWKGDSKAESTYTLNGDILIEEGIQYSWNDTTQIWVKPTNSKYSYKYKKTGSTWMVIEYKEYALLNGVFVLTYEDVREPNLNANDLYSSIVKTTSNGQLTNYSKTTKIYNIYNRIKQTDTYRWYNNQWVLILKDTYDYTSPDSIRTQTTYRTADYYFIGGYTQPALCSGQMLFPINKNVLKTHPISNKTELSYGYNWSNCAWTPTGTKYTYTYDATGTLRQSSTSCTTRTTTDWTGCGLYTYQYNAKGRQTLYRYVTDGNLYNLRTETEYLSDSIIKKTNYYKSYDINGDGVITDTEWISDGYRVYKYHLGDNSDSLHIDMNNLSSVEMYDFTTLKKLKVSGLLSCEELNEFNRLSYDSLEVLDLSDAQLERNILTDSCISRTGLIKLLLPKTLKELRDGAIRSGDDEIDDDNDKSLKELVIYPAIEKIEVGALYILNLEKITMPSKFFDMLYKFSSLSGINDVYKSTLKSVTFNDVAGKIPDAVCYNMPNLQKVTIEDGVTEIGNNAFKSCGMLQEVNLPTSTLRKIGYNAFWGCNELTALTLPEGLNTIDYSAFWGCSGVNSIIMPSSLTNIAQNAFWGCSAVSSIKVAALTPPVLGNNALQGVPREADVIVPENGISAYKAAPQWKEFFNMNTDIHNTQLHGVIITSSNGQLTLQNLPVDVLVNIYNITGVRINSFITTNKNEILQLTKGAYVIQIGNQHFKTLVK